MNFEKKLLSHRHVSEKGCWLWTGGKYSNGYGRFMINYKTYMPHRVSAHLHLGLDLEDKDSLVCHKCDNPACFNPEHLYLGNKSSNTLDSVDRNRNGNQNIRKTHCKYEHEFTPENTKFVNRKKNGFWVTERVCIKCDVSRDRHANV